MGIEQRTDFSPTPQHTDRFTRRRGGTSLAQRFGRVITVVEVGEETRATFLPSGRHVIDAQQRLIREASDHSYHQTYAFDGDKLGDEFIALWQGKHRADPTVRQHLLVDNGVAFWNANGTVRDDKVRQQRDATFDQLNGLEEEGAATVRVTNWFHLWNFLRSNPFHRDHKKITTADGEKAVVGSVNTVEHHRQWLDAGVLLEGPVARIIEQDVENTLAATQRWGHVFKAKDVRDYFRRGYWKEALKEPDQFLEDLLGSIVRNPQRRGSKTIIRSPNGDEMQVVTDSFFRHYREATRASYGLVEEARRGDVVDVISPYPGLVELTQRMMTAARKHKAEVNLHIPANNNYMLYNPTRAHSPVARKILEANVALWKWRLKRAGVHIYEFEGDEVNQGMTHFKSVSLRKRNGEQKVLIGSMNLSMGLFSGFNREIGVLLTQHHKEFMDEYNAFMNMVKKQSRRTF